MKKKIIFTVLVVQLLVPYLSAQEFYVNPHTGNDNNKGILQEPFKTIARAVQTANELTGQGLVTIKLMPGLYILEDKISINPVRVISGVNRFTIEAVIMPGDSGWIPEKTPVVKSVSGNNSFTQFPHSTGFLVSANNVTIRGIKFLGNPNPDILYYYPISREDTTLYSLEISQCYFLAERNSDIIQGGVWAHGQDISISRCIFSQCRNAILLFKNINRSSITNNIILDADEAAFWIGGNHKDFEFNNNVITRCHFFWVNSFGAPQTYNLTNSVISGTGFYLGKWDSKKNAIVELKENSFKEKNILTKGDITLVKRTEAKIPLHYLHVTSESAGYNLNAGVLHP